ncbi:hypothetical protein Emtol_1917 [Emticicia oligotrophica DSM 17448]|uniref:Uncharacterized protein n=1 Tax=Emticicia oligotrophica (strain DSM 17448 / CIP 109782 / MTCC 6937 / GPTSA100-15) TaxID=929562 RepID=A0ABN4ALY6_EMTOG|nr:hypothetical protein [Emticicia oligotrophica]AFK03057.1 hypothetical protein Emtol_1917 [Emticicia oligotrophica DSM 17448]
MNKKTIIYLLILLPIVGFYVFVLNNSFNIGWNDDWHGIEGFLASWMQQETFSEKIGLLFSQMCEHRILYVRLSTLLCYYLFGEANYQILMIMGVSYLMILPFVFYRLLREINLGLAYLIPILFFIFNIQPIENIFWAITSLQPNIVIIFGLWGFSLLLFNKQKWAFYLANVLFFIAMFTNGNGMFSFIAAIPLVFYARTRSERIQYLAILGFSFILYFFDFKKPGIRPDVMINFTQYPHILIADIFAFFGSPIDSTVQFYNIMLKYTVAILFGVLMLAWVLYQLCVFLYFWFQTTYKGLAIEKTSTLYQNIIKYPKFNLFLLAALIFVGLSGSAFAASRASQGLEQAFASRYKTVALILFIIVYLSFYNVIQVKNWSKYLKTSILVAFIFGAFSYYEAWDDVENRRKFFGTTILNWKNNGRYYYYAFAHSRTPDDHAPISSYQRLPIPPYNYAGFVPGVMKYVNDILWISRVHFKNYTPPAEIDSLNFTLYKNQIVGNSGELVKIKEESNLFHIEINNLFIPANRRYDGYYALFSNDKNRLAFYLETQANKFSNFLSSQKFYNNRIDVIVAKPDLPIGTFNMQIGKLENGQFKIIKEQVIEIK